MAEHKTPWRILQDFEPQTGPTTNVTEPFSGGKDWPFETIMVGMETIAIVPAQATYQRVGEHSPPIEGSATANARLIVTACNNHDKLVEALRELLKTDDMVKQIVYLSKGIGTATPKGITILKAWEVLKEVETQHGCSPVSMPKKYGKIRDGRIIGGTEDLTNTASEPS